MHRFRRNARSNFRIGAAALVATLAGCASTTPDSVRNLEVQAAAATTRSDTDSTLIRALERPDGRIALTRQQPERAEPSPSAQATIPAAQPEPASPAAVSSPVATPAPRAAGDKAALRSTIEHWREAWTRGDADAYLRFYEPQFKSGTASHADWEKQRRKRLANKHIDVQFDQLEVRVEGNEADVRFVQKYRSAGHSDTGVKHIKLRHEGGQWLISQEEWSPAKNVAGHSRKHRE